MKVAEWTNQIFKSYIEKHHPPKAEQEHVLDFLKSHPGIKLSTRVSYPSILAKAEAWTQELNRVNQNLKESGEVELIKSLGNNWSLVRLKDQTSKDWEGKHLGHCVSSYQAHQGLYSIRDAEHVPHCTIEVENREVIQIKGKANRIPKNLPLVYEALRNLDAELSSAFDEIDLAPLPPLLKPKILAHCQGVEIVEIKNKEYLSTRAAFTLSHPPLTFDPELFRYFIKLKFTQGGKALALISEELDTFEFIMDTVTTHQSLELLKFAEERVPGRLTNLHNKYFENLARDGLWTIVEYLQPRAAHPEIVAFRTGCYAVAQSRIDIVKKLYEGLRSYERKHLFLAENIYEALQYREWEIALYILQEFVLLPHQGKEEEYQASVDRRKAQVEALNLEYPVPEALLHWAREGA